MSQPPRFDDAALVRVLGIGARAPATFDRAGRVKLLGEAAQALLAGRMPSREAALFLAGGLLSWLQQGGNLCKTFWKVSGESGSHRTSAYVWRDLQDSSSRGEQDPESPDTIQTQSIESERRK